MSGSLWQQYHLISRQSNVLRVRQAWLVQAACGALKTCFISCSYSIMMTSQVDIAASDMMILRLGGDRGCRGPALCCVGRGVTATHRGQALLGVVAGSAHSIDDRGRLGGSLATVHLGFV